MIGWAAMYLYQYPGQLSEFYQETTRFASAGAWTLTLCITGTIKIMAAVLNIAKLRKAISFVGVWIWIFMWMIVCQLPTVTAGRYIAGVYCLGAFLVVIKLQRKGKNGG